MTSSLQKIYECFCCISKPKYPNPYNFTFTGGDCTYENKIQFESNQIKTSRYTWYNFLAKSLLLQFRRVANIYFLFIAILQSIPLISPLLGATAWVPLSVVLSVSIIREGYEDYQRYKSDKEMNHEYKTLARRGNQFQELKWKDVCVGDVCKVAEGELFPADMILLNSSNQAGIAYIQTASLDGEKNLKPRNSNKATINCCNQQNLNLFTGRVQSEIPRKELNKFSANMHINNYNQIVVFEGDKQLLYRGSRLKNTKWIYGLVIYTGRNTKIMINSQSSSQKMSQIQIKVNKVLVFIFCFQVSLCTAAAIIFGLFMRSSGHRLPYIYHLKFHPIADSIFIFFSYFILINSMIPISLIVSMQIVKMFQSYFIIKDKLMYSEYRKKSVSVKSASLNEQLGQIQYVFSDKTGTLTMNVMQFKVAIVGSRMYGDLGTIDGGDGSDNLNRQFYDDNLNNILKGRVNFQLQHPIQVKGGKQINIQSQKHLCQQYFTALSTAHQVVVQQNQKGQSKFQGPSPDQITLVEAAKSMGYEFIRSNQSGITVKINNQIKDFQVLQVFPFTSDRKRMSIILKADGIIKMYTKGADNIIKERTAKDNLLNLDHQLTNFSKVGLRTLLIAMRTISLQQYTRFKREVEKLPHANRQKPYNNLVSQLQQNLYVIGATAVLDRLQDFVPETIRDLIRANIKVWMLTGDKMETAENIARSCNLFQRDFRILKLRLSKQQECASKLKKLVSQSQQLSSLKIPKGLLLPGPDLSAILLTEQSTQQFLNLIQNCQAVVCCRLLPSQKANLVTLVKTRLNKITLAIGDGANDVPMLQAAHIGVGLFGEEGMNAVQASDYALGEFRVLRRLLFVHGRWNYIRISQMILYFFFKNMLFTIPQFVLGFFCGFSGQSMYDDWFIAFYNLIFTSIPLVVRAVLQQDVNYVSKYEPQLTQQTTTKALKSKNNSYKKVIQKQLKYLPPGYTINKNLYMLFPKIYFIGQQNCIFNYLNFFTWIIEAILEGVMICIFTITILGKSSIGARGYNGSFWMVGLTTYSAVICIVTFKICTHTKFLSKIFILSVTLLSLSLYISYMWISNYYFTTSIAGTTLVTWQTPKTYFTVIFCICIVLFLDGIVVHLDFSNGGYASKMRKIVDEQQHWNQDRYDQISLKFTDTKSEVGTNRKHPEFQINLS